MLKLGKYPPKQIQSSHLKGKLRHADLESRGIEWYIEKLTWVPENFGPISKSQKRFGWISKSRSLESVVFSLISVWSSGVDRIFSEFVATAYRTKLLD